MTRDDAASTRRDVQLHAGPREAIGPAIAMLSGWFDLDGTPLASSADILLRKMQGRTLTQGRAVARDAYDFVVARAVDPVAFRDAIAHLDERQAEVIAETFEVLADTPPRTEGRGVEAPAYPAVLEQGLWNLAAQVFRHPQRDLDIGKGHRDARG